MRQPGEVEGAAPVRGALVVEVLAALTVAVVVLPQSLAFGLALLGSHGVSGAQAAAAGLLGAIVLNIGLGLAAGTRGMVAAPAGPTTVLLVGAFASLSAAGLAPGALPLALSVMLVGAGLMQAVLGLLGGGRVVQFIPYPVVAGFMTGAGLAMALGQLRLVWPSATSALEPRLFIPLAVAVATALGTQWLPRLVPRLPGSLLGLLLGTVLYHGLCTLAPGAPLSGWVVGPLPGLESLSPRLPSMAELSLPWRELLGATVAFALLGALNTLLVAVVADGLTGQRHSAGRTLLGLGAGQIAAGVLGGVGGTASTGPTLVAAGSAGGRWLTLGSAFVLLLMLTVGGGLGRWLPVSALAGLLLHTAWKMVAWEVLAWLRSRRARQDAGIALLVTFVTLTYDLVTAVGAGVVIAAVLFVKAQFEAPVVHRRSTAAQRHSMRARTLAEREILDARGEEVVIYELRGSLFFAKADRLYQELTADIARGACVILHFRRVQQVDLTSLRILLQIAKALSARGGQLLFCEVHAELGLGADVGKALKAVSPDAQLDGVLTFNGSDEALEYAEDRLLHRAGSPAAPQHARVPLGQSELCQGLSPESVAALEQVMPVRQFAPEEVLFGQGDRDDALFVVVTGLVDVRLATSQHHYMRLSTYGPGTVFGAVAFLDPGERTASAVARAPTQVRVLNRAGFTRLLQTSPECASGVLLNLGGSQSQSLRWSAAEIRRLAEW